MINYVSIVSTSSVKNLCNIFIHLKMVVELKAVNIDIWTGNSFSTKVLDICNRAVILEWKQRYYNHKQSFKSISNLSSDLWWLKLKTSKIRKLTWSILKADVEYSNTSKRCLLRLQEKLYFILALTSIKRSF